MNSTNSANWILVTGTSRWARPGGEGRVGGGERLRHSSRVSASVTQ
jgi:hypothetical protein